jgi:LPPG:FO 2-phospho-L-lactate transferase
VARAYADFLDVLVIDDQDAALAPQVEAAGPRAIVTDTIMRDVAVKKALAQVTLEQAGVR